MEKLIIQGQIQGTQKRGRPKLRWTDGIKEMTDRLSTQLTDCLRIEIDGDLSSWVQKQSVMIHRLTMTATQTPSIDFTKIISFTK